MRGLTAIVGVITILAAALAHAGAPGIDELNEIVKRFLELRQSYLQKVDRDLPADEELSRIATQLRAITELDTEQADQYLLRRVVEDFGPIEEEVVRALLLKPKPKTMKGLYDRVDSLAQMIGEGEVEAVYLLSDGEPTMGRFTEPGRIVREIRHLNSISQVTIHCISLGYESPLLESLAAESGGEYRQVGKPIPRDDD